MNDENTSRRRRRTGIFFPLLLIGVGVIILLNTLGVISGDVWSLIWQFWPLLLIVIGLDSIFRREGYVASTFIIGVGIIILLANLGYLSISVWQMIFTLWPILLIAIGFDILIGGRSIWASLVGMVLIVVILLGSLSLFGVNLTGGSTISGEEIQQSLNGATSASVLIEDSAGDIQIGSTQQPDMLLEGRIPSNASTRVQTSYTVNAGIGEYTLQDTGTQIFIPGGSVQNWQWNLDLTDAIPLDLALGIGAGNIEADLSALNLDSLKVDMAVGNTTVSLPEEGRFDGRVNGAIGQIVIVVPRNVGIRINPDTALVTVSAPSGYSREGDIYVSPNYDAADNRINLSINLAIGNVEIREE